MKSKKVSAFIIFLLVITSIFSYQYLKLRQEYNKLHSRAKYNFTYYLNSSLTFASRVDINKVKEGNKESILYLIRMDEAITNSYAASEIIFKPEFVFIDPVDMGVYQSTLGNIINKAMNNELTDEDINRFNLITNDIKLMYRYVSENDNINYLTELKRNLKLLNIPLGK